jgi:bile acid:Na+ symporter, BASS family
MDTTQAIFNTVLAVFIVTTMLNAGFNTTFDQITSALSRVRLVTAVLVVAFVVRPLIGWGIAELFALATPAFIAMALLWSAPGAPFGAKLVMTANADVQTGAVLQVLLAVIGSITFAPTANAILSGAALGDGVSLPVGDLVKTVAALQLIPFALGIVTRHWADARAVEWSEFALRTSNVTFLFVIAGAFLGSWDTIVDLVGSRVNLAAIAASAVVIAIGYLGATGQEPGTRQAAALIQPGTNAGPAFAAVAIAFDGDPDILGAVVAILLFQMVIGLTMAVYFARTNADTGEATTARI